MASSSSGFPLPAPEAVQVLVSSLADDIGVSEASMTSLKDIASLNPLLVLDCCSVASRGGHRRFGNMAGVFQVMAFAVRAMDKREADPTFMSKLAKIATSEMISSKELNADWQRAAASLLVSVGSHLPDLMIEEVFLHLSGPKSALPSMVQILADFASSEVLQFIPRLKLVLSRILPILGNVKDSQRPIFANAFKCWCQATWHYNRDFPCDSLLDNDIMSFLNSAFELLLGVWANSRDLKVRLSSVEALGQMVGLITGMQLKAALPRLVPTILTLYKNIKESALLASCSLHNVLNASLLSENGPLLEFEELTVILYTLIPILLINDSHSHYSVGLKTYNEVQHCFLVVGLVYPEDLFMFLLNRCKSKEEPSTAGALSVLKHLLPRLSEPWHGKMPLLVETIKLLLDEKSVAVRKALAELIVVMASHCYLVGSSGELFVEFLIFHCAMSDGEPFDFERCKDVTKTSAAFQSSQYKKLEVKMGEIYQAELQAVCEKGLLLIAITIPEMEHVLWPFMLKMIIPQKYTGAVATVCRCISELCRRTSSFINGVYAESIAHAEIPSPEEIFARLLVMLHDPLARKNMATQILTVLYNLAPLFPRNIILFWQDEIPKMKVYVSDTEDLRQDSSYQETWEAMIINFLAESLDVVQDENWVVSLGNAFTEQYKLYVADHEHSALLHRCLGMLLQKVDNRDYVNGKIDLMYKHANISVPTNRLGLAKGIGLVAASHLDTVLGMLKKILDSVGRNKFQRFLSFFYERVKAEDTDDIHAALALMYGYAARYAPSAVIEARIDALLGTNMLSRLLHVRHPTAKQAVITAIDLLGCAVINANENGRSFPLKKRDLMLDYILTLMGRDVDDGIMDSNLEFLQTQTFALSACTTLVSVEPKLPVETRNYVMKATLSFFSLPNDPSDLIDPLIKNLITLLCAILLTSGEDGRSRAEQLLHILRQIDQYVSSSVEHQRRRGCVAVYELLLKFRTLCSSGYCGLGCREICIHSKNVEWSFQRNSKNLPAFFVYPSRESLCLGERVMAYLPRCADPNSEVRKLSAQVLDLFFSISLSLPRAANSTVDADIEMSYAALSSIEDVIAILRSDASIDRSEVFKRVVSSVCTLLTKDELVSTLHGCTSAICDKVKQSAEGAIEAVIELITRRGNEMKEADVSRIAHSLLSATVLVADKQLRQEVLGAICCLAENSSSTIVYDEVLASAGRDIVTKDITRIRGGWPLQEAFYAFSQHPLLSVSFLEHVISVLNQTSILKDGFIKGETQTEEDTLQAAVLALAALFRGGGKTGKKVVEQSYAVVLCALILQLGCCHHLAGNDQQQRLWTLLRAFQAFCECVGDLEMGKILARDGEQNENEKWIGLIGDLASCMAIKRPKEIPTICLILTEALKRQQRIQREAAAAALSEFIRYSGGGRGVDSLMEQMVEAMCLSVTDDSPTVRRLCVRGLVQIPANYMLQYTSQVLAVIIALLEDPDEIVQSAAVQSLLTVMESSSKEAVDPFLSNLCIRIRNLQISMNVKMRANAFSSFGALSSYISISGVQAEAFIEQVNATLPRLVLHVGDEDFSVRQACRNTLRRIVPFTRVDGLSALFNTNCFNSDHRSDYEDFIRNVTKLLCQNFANRTDNYISLAIQAFDAPWPVIQANAIYFCSNLLSLLDDQRSASSYVTQVFGFVVGKMSQSPDMIVRATCASALGILLKAHSSTWKESRLDRVNSERRSHEFNL